MINKLFDARSPLWQLILALLFVSWFSYAAEMARSTEYLKESGGFELTVGGPFAVITALIATVVFIAAYVVVARYNRRHPNNKMSLWQIYPPEVMEHDEMYMRASQSAAKRVYLYNNIALPLLILAVLFYREFPIGLGVVFAVYLAGYYLTFLRTMWPYLGED